ncbi:uncharacterized protein E5676_scaffold477G00760 [Cucumis melo var. makuwa]|uniref:Chromo domain-containing protein n=1 Tax=Cucumis melo var. makuwa TaxID=1194695 RepID=A0A5A7TLB9_CUCMM|nr:uncharacterized protein E6C27_scaffold795G00860 [Cucumis melo var. makuwa]TYK15490.1 uncharacterized protein E5676_scaffold477G00760 [Cucumis melo var. makuwa]
MVKILWSNHGVKEATWENEEQMKVKYPQLIMCEETFTGKCDLRKDYAMKDLYTEKVTLRTNKQAELLHRESMM